MNVFFLCLGSEDTLEDKIAALTKVFVDVANEVKLMELRLKKAKAIKERLERLRRSHDYMDDVTVHEIEKCLAQSKNNNPYLEEKLDKYKILKEKIEQQEGDPAYLTVSGFKLLQEKHAKAKQVLQTIQTSESNNLTSQKSFNNQLNVKEGTSSELECVICLELPVKQVFSCLEHHILCRKCDAKVDKCPICRQSFKTTPTTRHRLAEKIILRLKTSIRTNWQKPRSNYKNNPDCDA